jgi:ABC-type lipoprotein release transport system permease subunit
MSYLFLIVRRLLFKRRSSLIKASMAVAAMIFLITFNDVVFSGVFSAVERGFINFQYGDIVIKNEQQFLDETDSSIMKQMARNPGVEASAPRITVIAYEVNYSVGGQTASKVIDILDGVVREVIHKTEFHCPTGPSSHTPGTRLRVEAPPDTTNEPSPSRGFFRGLAPQI